MGEIPEDRPSFDLDTILRAMIDDHEGEFAQSFSEMAETVPDDHLLDLVKLADEVKEVVYEYLYKEREDQCFNTPLHERINKARITEVGVLKIPVADRKSLAHFFEAELVDQALEDYVDTQLNPENDSVYVETEIHETVSSPEIDDLPKTVEQLPVDDLLLFAAAYFWSAEGETKYVFPSSTLQDIVRDAPPELLIPIALTIAEYFPKVVDDDGCYRPVVRMSGTQNLLVEDGIVWRTVTLEEIRKELSYACESDSLSNAPYVEAVDGELFDSYFENAAADYFQDDEGNFDDVGYNDVRDKINDRYFGMQKRKYPGHFS